MKNATPIFFIVNDPLRAVGLEKKYPNLHIVCIDYNEIVDWLVNDGVKVFCLEKELGTQNEMFRNTRDLLTRDEVVDYILTNSNDVVGLVFFKPMIGIEDALSRTVLSSKRQVKLLHPDSKLASKLENKIFFHELLEKHRIKHPRSFIKSLSSVSHDEVIGKFPNGYVIQFARGWFGNATYFITAKDELVSLQKDNRDRIVKISEYVPSTVLTNNIVVAKSQTYQTYPFLQITDQSGELSRYRGSTVGNHWVGADAMPFNNPLAVVEEVRNLTEMLGEVLRSQGYSGFAGLDFLVSEEDEVFVQEINPRFTASAEMITQMEMARFGNSLQSLHFGLFGFNVSQKDPNPATFFEALSGVRVVARNTGTEELVIGTKFDNGVYSLSSESFDHVRAGYDVASLADKEAIIYTASKNREVNTDQEIIQLQSLTLTKDEALQQVKKSRKSSRIANRIVNFSPGDYVLAGVVLVLTIFGVVMVYNTGLVVAFEQFGDKYWFFKNQSLWAVLGIIGGFIVSNLNHEVWKRLGVWLFVISVIMLLLVLIPGFSPQVYGAKQRLVIPGVPFLDRLSIQPSELVKLSLIIYLSALFVKEKAEKGVPLYAVLVVLGVVAGLTAVEPDLGNAILITSSALVVFFAAGANVFVFMGILAVGLVSALLYALSSEYRRQRILTFLNLFRGTSSVSYHITQIFIALGSGGFLGLGLGNSRQKYQYIPEVTTDSIFAIIGEELGFVGAVLVIAALVFIIWRGFKIASECKDEFGRLLALGVTANIGFQAIVNLGGMVGIMPFTGVPLPFISYGGTSLTLLLISVGILLSISRSNNLNKR